MFRTQKKALELLSKFPDENTKWFVVGFTDEDIDDVIRNVTGHEPTDKDRERVLWHLGEELEYTAGLQAEDVDYWCDTPTMDEVMDKSIKEKQQ